MKSLKEIRSFRYEEKELEELSIQVPESLEISDLPPIMEEDKQKHNQPHDPPAVLIMKRKAIRQFPNGQRVALYYIDKLNKYVTVPYSTLQWSAMPEEVSEIDSLKSIIESNRVGQKITNEIMEVYNSLNDNNKQKFMQMAESDFSKLLEFVIYKK